MPHPHSSEQSQDDSAPAAHHMEGETPSILPTATEPLGTEEPRTLDHFAEAVEPQEASPTPAADELHERVSPLPTSEEPVLLDIEAGDAGPAGFAADEVLSRLDQLAGEVRDLQGMFATKILRSESEAQINARLHGELQNYKADVYAKLLKPVLHDLITVREHILRLAAKQRSQPPEDQRVSLDTFASFADDLGQILEENDVEIHHSEPGSTFVPGLQQIVAKIDSDDPDAHRTIASVSGDGYSFQNRPLAPQRVTVFAFTDKNDGK